MLSATIAISGNREGTVATTNRYRRAWWVAAAFARAVFNLSSFGQAHCATANVQLLSYWIPMCAGEAVHDV